MAYSVVCHLFAMNAQPSARSNFLQSTLSISADELIELMSILQIDTSSDEVLEMIQELDEDGNDSIDFEEFVQVSPAAQTSLLRGQALRPCVLRNNEHLVFLSQVMSRKVNASYTADQVKGAFKIFEGASTKEGSIKVEALIDALMSHGTQKLSLEEATALVAQLEPDAEGNFNYEEYVNLMMHD